MRFYEASDIPDLDIRVLLKGRSLSMSRALSQARLIIESVKRDGDPAVLKFARKFDGFVGGEFIVAEEEIAASESRVARSLRSALRQSRRRIEAYHSRQLLNPFEYTDAVGTFGQKVVPLERVGVYVPGGTASYASSVLMAAIPARIAGVKEIALFTPSRKGGVDDAVLAAAHLCGISELYSIGGAHAIAAMAYGTETIRAVDKIVGPGGPIVTAAKLLVRDDCDIDLAAGPSEVMIVADGSADPDIVALELVAQLEHDRQAVAVAVSPSETLLRKSMKSLTGLMRGASRRDIISAAAKNGAVFVKARSLTQAMELSNRFAPEHLMILTKDPDSQLRYVQSAGSVFLGEASSVAFGDYCAGPNHVLPTMGAAKARSSLSVYDFLKTIPYQSLTKRGAARLAPVAIAIASAEGLPNHALAANARLGGRKG